MTFYFVGELARIILYYRKPEEDAVQDTNRIDGKPFKRVLLGAVVLSLLPSLAIGQTTGRITLTGKIDVFCGLRVEATDGAKNINMAADATRHLVATVEEICNVPYTVTMRTENGDTTGMLKSPTAEVYDEMPYDVLYGSSSSPAVITGKEAVVTLDGQPTIHNQQIGVKKNVEIKHQSYVGHTRDTEYTDTLTFTIAAKN
ncbi:MAG: hypothetical protein GDA41_01370 [Rhodospirillales bacterium]|nr:hypothetical protein [Rhodospirillales bacterium]